MATLMPLPSSFTYRFLDRPLLWSWAGSVESKPERSEMLTALNEHEDAGHIAKRESCIPLENLLAWGSQYRLNPGTAGSTL